MQMPAMAQNSLTDADIADSYTTRTYNHRVSCHDPSIVVDNVTNPASPVYYVYGSHLGHGSTTAASNYQDWDTSWGAGEAAGTANSLFANSDGTLINFANAYSTQAVSKVKDYQGNMVNFPNFDAHAWQYTGNSVQGMEWAPDIIYNTAMGKWCLYMSLNGDNWCSSIVMFTSDSPKGPWTYQAPVVMSGFSGRFDHNGYGKADDWKKTDLAIATGATSLPQRYNIRNWGDYWPNCIDPCVFYDDAGNLWMTYGSWSGGIFELKLDAQTGLRDYTHKYDYEVNGTVATPGAADQNCTSDPYFGRKIAGGCYVSGEGSYVQKIGDYYFLFLSYGGLNPSQGYQIRIFRSTSPEGPFTDANGTSARFTSYALNYGARATDNRGVLLMDGYQWQTMPKGEVAQGHNSAFVDDKGRAFVVYHTKFNDGTFGHEVRVHQLFLNEDGWLVASPYEFSGSTATNSAIASAASVADAEIPGDYQFIRHQYNQSHAQVSSSDQATTARLKEPVNITLNADGTITGAAGSGVNSTSKWTRKAGTDFITLTINGVEYKGVLVKETTDYTDIPSLSIAALSDNSGNKGVGQGSYTFAQEVWAVKADTKPAIKYTLDHLNIPFQDGATINSNVNLPETGYLGTKVKWTSSDMNVFDSDFGEITGTGPVTLTVEIDKDGYAYKKEYSLYVDKNAKPSTPVYYPESQQKDLTATWWTNFSKQYYTLKKGTDAEFKFYNYSDKAENWDNWCLVAANGERNTAGYAEYFVLRNDNFGWGTCYDAANLSSAFNWDTFKDDMDGSLVDMKCAYATDGKFTMTSTITTAAGKVYNYSFSANITDAPEQTTLFFVNEKSYIDGSTLVPTGITTVNSDSRTAKSSALYNLAGQRVNRNYRGVVIENGRKYINR